MRHLPFFFVTSVVALVPFVACDDSSGSGGGDAGFTFDGSFNAPDVQLPDGSVPDAAPDAPPSDSVTVVVTKTDAPEQGINVVVGDATGTLVATGLTGADGKATIKVTAGQQVTVLLGDTPSRQAITYLGVKPGDVLTVVDRSSRNVRVNQNQGAPGGGVNVNVGNRNCATNTATVGVAPLIFATPDCYTGATFPVVSLLSYNSQIWWSYKKGNTFAASGESPVNGMSAWAVGTTFTLDVTNAPAVTTPYVDVGLVADNQAFSLTPSSITMNAGAGSKSFLLPSGYPDAYQGAFHNITTVGSNTQTQSFAVRIASGVASQTLDLTAGMLPTIATLVPTNLTGARPTLTWTTSAALTAADSGVATLHWNQALDGGGMDTIDWTFVLPPDTTTVTAPQLPAQLAAWQPTAGAINVLYGVAFFESDLLPSYDYVRQNAGAAGLTRLPQDTYQTVQLPALPANGRLRTTTLSNILN